LSFIEKVNQDEKLMMRENFKDLLMAYVKLIKSMHFLEELIPRKIADLEDFKKFYSRKLT